MDEQFIRDRITKLREQKNVSERRMSLAIDYIRVMSDSDVELFLKLFKRMK